ncbi:holo-ACP synthase [Caviibacter abscessus]|uniref:holo-ACP synthase n=1 Tax=Caviibacter abscessus TaxID=1766719 RepID=UPI000829B270|nr:holo-ACP synthase [Caviibacter abscessus]
MRIGTDIVEVDRIKQAIEKNNNFKEKVFTKAEIKYCENKKNKYESYSGRFSAKEAFVKALGTGFTDDISFLDIEILNDENGKPCINYKGKNYDVSISHEKRYAIAMVLIESL